MTSKNSNNNHYKNIELASQIFSDYGAFIRSIIYTKVQDKQRADDISQDFFLSLVHKPIPPNVRNIKGFLYRAIINDILDANRRMERYTTHTKKYGEKIKSSINKTQSKNAFIEKEQIINMLELIKEQLPSSCSQAIILRYRDNQSIKEVAKQMGVKKASVSRYISTGLKKLRRLWALK